MWCGVGQGCVQVYGVGGGGVKSTSTFQILFGIEGFA